MFKARAAIRAGLGGITSKKEKIGEIFVSNLTVFKHKPVNNAQKSS